MHRARALLPGPSADGRRDARGGGGGWLICGAAGAAIAVIAASCVPEYTFVDPPGAGAGGGGGSQACAHETYPGRPEGAPDGPGVDFVVAVRRIDFGDKADSPPVGLDLDGACTCQGDDATCAPPDPTQPSCDLAGGRDNQAGAIFTLIQAALGTGSFGSAVFSEGAEKGIWTVLLRVHDYNGQPDDPQVTVDWLASPGLEDPPPWSGSDVWPVQADSLIDGDPSKPLSSDPAAYVAGGKLVASLPDAPMRVANGLATMTFQLTSAYVVGAIEAAPEFGGAYVLRDALFVCRWTMSDVFRSISTYRDGDGNPYCIGDSFYESAKQQLCNAVDILSIPGTPTTPCDAISLGVMVQTAPAAIGAVASAPPTMGGCPIETDPIHDSCAAP